MIPKAVSMTSIGGWGPLPDLVRDMAGERALRRLLRFHDLPSAVLAAPQHRIPLAKMVSIFDAAALAVGDEAFGARIGAGTRIGDFGDWGAYSAGASVLSEGLKRVCSAIWIHESGSRMFLSEREHHVVWCYATGLSFQGHVRQFSDHLLQPMLDFVRAYQGVAWQPDWIELDYARPQRQGHHPGLPNTPAIYESAAFGLPIRRADLGHRRRVPDLLPRPLTSVDLHKHRHRLSGNPVEPILEIIDLCMLNGSTDLDCTARVLDVGPRTLQRRLTRQGLTFRQLLERSHRRRAVALLLETDRPVKAIAADLGYREPDNFTRAFRTWFGRSPTAFRTGKIRAGPDGTTGPG